MSKETVSLNQRQNGASQQPGGRQQEETVVRLPLTDLHSFPDHPYEIRNDAAMQDTIERVRASGVIMPAIVRPRFEDGYEIIAGHRRKVASELAGYVDMPCIIQNLNNDEAVFHLVDSNAQRADVLLRALQSI